MCIALMAVAFVLWLFSSIQARGNITNDMSALGLFSILPWSFFVACSMLVISFFVTLRFVDKNRGVLLVAQTFLLIFFLNLTPAIVEGTARFTTNYANFKAVDYITQTGTINPSQNWILNWPDFSILLSMFAQITTIPGEFILLTYPTVFNFLLLPALYVLFRTMSNNSTLAWVGTWFVFLGNWIGQDYFSMQSIAFLVAIIIIIILFKSMNQKIHSRQYGVLFFILFFYIVASHFLTSLAILCVIIALYLTKQLARPVLLISAGCLVGAWAIFDASTYMASNLVKYVNQAFDFSLIFQKNLTHRLSSGSASHILASDIRVFYSVAIIAFAVAGIALAWRSKSFGKVEKRAFTVLGGLGLLTFAFVYGGELFSRLYMFSLIPFAYFAAKAMLSHKKVLLVGALFFVVLAPSLYYVARYGNETMDYVPPSELTGINFLFSTTTSGHIIGGISRTGEFRDLNYRGSYTIDSFSTYRISNMSSIIWEKPRDLFQNRYVCISYGAISTYSFFYNDLSYITSIQGNITQCPLYDLLYSNPSFEVYTSVPLS